MAKARRHLYTPRGYDFFEVASALQKSIRRGQSDLAGYFALEFFASGYIRYLWKRLLIISTEDCFGAITHEIVALYQAFLMVNANNKRLDNHEGRLFLVKAVLILSITKKCRDADHLICLLYDKRMVEDEKVKKYLSRITAGERKAIPEYALDQHTLKGKLAGRTDRDFFTTELAALFPREPGLFDSSVEECYG